MWKTCVCIYVLSIPAVCVCVVCLPQLIGFIHKLSPTKHGHTPRQIYKNGFVFIGTQLVFPNKLSKQTAKHTIFDVYTRCLPGSM